jgi:DNA transformation protein
MATRQLIVDFILEQMSGVPDVAVRKMFGEFAVYSMGKVVALVCDDQLFVKPTEAGRRLIGMVTERAPYPGAKPCFLVEGDLWEDGDWLSELIRTTAHALPMPKPKPAALRPARPLTRSISKTRAPAGAMAKSRTKREATSNSTKRTTVSKPKTKPKGTTLSKPKAKSNGTAKRRPG